MDAEEKLRWKTLYASYPDEIILEMLSQDPGSFQEGAYDLLQSEVKRRGINPDEQALEEIVFVVIYAGDQAHVMDLRGTLEFEGIATLVRDEATWAVDTGGRIGVMKLAVEKKDVERARRIIEELSR